MMQSLKAVIILTLAVSLLPEVQPDTCLAGENTGHEKSALPLRLPVTDSTVNIDGVIEESAWNNALQLDLPVEIYPGENVPTTLKTECFVTHDKNFFYVAFRAHEETPSSIRAHLSDRDNISADDQVGFTIDTFNDEHRGYSFFCNPLGIQYDAYRDDFAGGVDESWDSIWHSAGRITAEGYEVEFAIPFSQIRFQRSDENQIWGFNGTRIHPRDKRTELATQEIDIYSTAYFSYFTKIIGFEGLSPGMNLQVTPTLTSLRTDSRSDFPGGDVEMSHSESEAGLSVKWGMTPNFTLNATVNPDFSQVEADVAQLDVNIKYALYFSETRPFFLEGANIFDTPINAVHTRTIADPTWGIKVTGKEGKHTIGLLTARDNITTLLFPGSQGSRQTTLDMESSTAIFRYQFDANEKSSLGFLFTDRQGDDYQNIVAGFDASLKLTSVDDLNIQYLGSRTKYPDSISSMFNQPAGEFDGTAMKVLYIHNSRKLDWYAYYWDLGHDFRADAGFSAQSDFRYLQAGAGYTFWGEKNDPYVLHNYWLAYYREEDEAGTALYDGWRFWTNYVGPMQSLVTLYIDTSRQFYGGSFFNLFSQSLVGSFQPTGNSYIYLSARRGDAIDYNNIRKGKLTRLSPYLRYRFGRHLELVLRHDYERFSQNGERLYLANLSQLRIVYQFNPHLFLRLTTQYRDIRRTEELYTYAVQPESRDWFNQLLFSYKINPQTVLYLGYVDNSAGTEDFGLTLANRTFFAKIGYAWLM